jgi:hypothetical protein
VPRNHQCDTMFSVNTWEKFREEKTDDDDAVDTGDVADATDDAGDDAGCQRMMMRE